MNIDEVIHRVIIDVLGIEQDELKDNASLMNDLGADSLDLITILIDIEDELGITLNIGHLVDEYTTIKKLKTLINEIYKE